MRHMKAAIGLALANCALTTVALAGDPSSAASTAAHSSPAATSASQSASLPSQPKGTGKDCIRSTGSRVPPDKGKCLQVPGSTYSQKDIRSTGQTNAASALRQLDPRIHSP